MTAPLCIVVKGFPRLSETFITRELEALQDAGVDFSIASLRRPAAGTGNVVHRVSASRNYLPEYLHEEPARVWRGILRARKLPGFARAWRMFRADLNRDMSRNRVRRFGQACVLSAELPETARHLHAHFIHTPASVARYAAAISGVTFSVSAHAKDIWTTPEWDLADKLKESTFVCTCNAAGADRLGALASNCTPHLWPHLVHAAGVKPPGGRMENCAVRLITVARAVPKKGLEMLLEALARLPPNLNWTWTQIGGGPGIDSLRETVRHHPYRDRLTLLGARPHAEALEALRRHDVFVLTAAVAEDGDRDGRPNAVIEAMDAGLACVATPVGGIPELLSNGAGVLAEAESGAIADTIASLLANPARIVALGAAARARASELRREGERAFREIELALRKASGQ